MIIIKKHELLLLTGNEHLRQVRQETRHSRWEDNILSDKETGENNRPPYHHPTPPPPPPIHALNPDTVPAIMMSLSRYRTVQYTAQPHSPQAHTFP